MTPTELVLIDLSSIAHPIWHTTQSDPDPNKASHQIVARVRTLTANHPHAAICCDAGRSFRHDISAAYKANRPEHDATLQHQINLAVDQLKRDGFPVWAVKGFEADDLIASATKKALETEGRTVLIVSADKDLLQLVGPRVRAMAAGSGAIAGPEEVAAKFGVLPEQMRDYLTLVGDTSDNVKGARGIGPKKAAELLAKFRTLDRLYEDLDTVGGASLGLPGACIAALKEFKEHFPTTRQLITLRADVELPLQDIDGERRAKAAEDFGSLDLEEDGEDEAESSDREPLPFPPPAAPTASTSSPEAAVADAPAPAADTRMARREPIEAAVAGPVEWQLQPRTMHDARVLATDMHKSQMFSAYGSPAAVLSTVMLGRELGLPAMASLRLIYNVEGRHGLAASLMVALILKSGIAEYFRPVEISEIQATYETLRKGPGNKPFTLTHTIVMAHTAQLVKPNSNWVKVPTDMLVARAQSRLARLIYPDIIGGLYTPEELAEIRESMVA